MATYISIPAIDLFVHFVEEDPECENAIKGLTSSILQHYFPPGSGYAGVPRPNRNGSHPFFIVLRIKLPRGTGFFDHVVVDAKTDADRFDESLEQFKKALENADTAAGRCWGVLIRGVEFRFYEYHRDRPPHDRLLPWGPPDQPAHNTYHVRRDSDIIDWMFRHMVEQDIPPIHA